MAGVRERRWTELAACTEVGSEPFFPEEKASAAPAITVCRSCEVRVQCLEYALGREEGQHRHGVWGGFTANGRVRVARKRRSGLSLEDAIAGDDAEFYAGLDKSAEVAEAALARRRAREKALRAARAALADPERAA